MASIQLDMPHGCRYIHRTRSFGMNALRHVFEDVNKSVSTASASKETIADAQSAKQACGYAAELYMGHLRYGTSGANSEAACHPFHRQSNWKTRNLVVAGNFNLTNIEQLLGELVKHGQHPVEVQDTVVVMERLAVHLDKANHELHQELSVLEKGEQDHLTVQSSRRLSIVKKTNRNIAQDIADRLDIANILKQASHDWDGGYVIGTMFGHGDACVLRDRHGIRPVWYYADEEVVVVASERPPIQTAFNLPTSSIKEVPPGHALIIRRDNTVNLVQIHEPLTKESCSFERIYFARPTDADIYQERRNLGKCLSKAVLKAIDYDLKDTVFSFIPNSAETCFSGLVDAMQQHTREVMKKQILELGSAMTPEKLDEIMSLDVRVDKVAIKDQKLRTFIVQDADRDDIVAHVYDVTYGIIRGGVDTLVAVDDSIVRGTTMSCSILRMFDRLHPKQIVLVSSAPQIRYPDCYGIDMAKMGDFIAFRAAVALLKETGQEAVLSEVYYGCLAQEQEGQPDETRENLVKAIYAPFTADEISEKIGQLLKPKSMSTPVRVVYQTVEDVHRSCPGNSGDWYFTGNYPTAGGAKVCNRAYAFWYEGRSGRACDNTGSPKVMQNSTTRRSSLG